MIITRIIAERMYWYHQKVGRIYKKLNTLGFLKNETTAFLRRRHLVKALNCLEYLDSKGLKRILKKLKEESM